MGTTLESMDLSVRLTRMYRENGRWVKGYRAKRYFPPIYSLDEAMKTTYREYRLRWDSMFRAIIQDRQTRR